MFDLLTALLDSWTLWSAVAGSKEVGTNWRTTYLELTYAAGAYRSYEDIVAEAARHVDIPTSYAAKLMSRWDELVVWPEVPHVLSVIGKAVPLAVATNCSESLAKRAISKIDAGFAVMVSAERAGSYKPRPEPYRLALAELGVPPERALFVAGSRLDLPGAAGVGMPVFWHNRIGLPLPDTTVKPVAIAASLLPLLDLPASPWEHHTREA